jgi:hypothetical protein
VIRKATFDDIPAMLALGRRAHVRSRYRDIAVDEAQAKLNAASMMTNRAQCVFVAEEEGRLVGMLMGVSMPWFFSREPYATDLFVYAEKAGAGRALVQRFVHWAFEERRVAGVELLTSFGGDARQQRLTEAMYKRLGAERVGSYFSIRRAAQAAREAA